jgi:hypothetical protein
MNIIRKAAIECPILLIMDYSRSAVLQDDFCRLMNFPFLVLPIINGWLEPELYSV